MLHRLDTAFGCPRDYLDNKFVYLVISPRLRGLSIGVNVSPEVRCNFYCVYCEVQRPETPNEDALDLDIMVEEFQKTLMLVRTGRIAKLAGYRGLNPELLTLQQVVISGDGEPTLAPKFHHAVQRIIHLRAVSTAAYFKLVLFTNGSSLHEPGIWDTLKFFTAEDEIWIKLDAGTQEYMSSINGVNARLDVVLDNILKIGRVRPVGIQSLFPMVNGSEPPQAEIDAYVQRLKELKDAGANISLVQVFSAAHPARMTGCEYLPLKSLFRICHQIKSVTGLRAEVF